MTLEIDVRKLLRAARQWWWVGMLIPILFSFLAVGYTREQTPLYKATAKIFVNPSGSGQLDYNAVLSAERLTKTYQRMVKNREVLQPVIDNNSLPFSAGRLSKMTSVRAQGDTNLLEVTVQDSDPDRAALIANAIADQFALYVKQQPGSMDGQSMDQLQAAFADVDQEISDTEVRIAQLKSLPNASDASVQEEISSLEASLATLRPTYASLLAQLADAKANSSVSIDRVTVAGKAYPATAPFSPNLKINVLLGLILGMTVAVVFILILDYRDNTVKATTDFGQVVNAPLLSTVVTVNGINKSERQLFVLEQPKSTAAESIRLLRTNVEFASATKQIATLGVTSAYPGEGKSTIAANLAVTLSQAGFVTALIDADLRRPSQHRIWGIANDRGISSLLTFQDRTWDWAAHESVVPNLTVIPAGPLPPNPADLLSLERLNTLLREMQEHFDVIVVDTPPVLAVSDPLIVAAHLDGMIVVSLGGKTRIDALKRVTQTLQRGAIRVVGVVVNQHSSRSEGGYYYREYHAVGESKETRRIRRSKSAVTPMIAEQPAPETRAAAD